MFQPCNQEFELRLHAKVGIWLRAGLFVGLFDSIEQVCIVELERRLQKVQQYAALLPLGLRCMCRSNARLMPLAEQHWPCCVMFAQLAPFSVPTDSTLKNPWELGIDE